MVDDPRPDATARVREQILRAGPMRFDAVMEIALYDADAGFFATAATGGRRGDFLTSPEVGPLFGAVVANALDSWWERLGRPDPFIVVEAGAGRGALAISVRHARPACTPALTYVLVEASPTLRARHPEHLPIESPELALLPLPHGADGDADSVGQGSGPRFVSLPDLPALTFRGVVLANELLDNLVFRVVVRTGAGWSELYAGPGTDTRDPAAADGLEELWVPMAGEACADLDAAFPDVAEGAPIPLQRAAGEWVRQARAALAEGAVLVFDYAADTTELSHRDDRGWLRTFVGHQRGGPPLADLGHQDITADVAVDQLVALAGVPTADTTQAEWLRAHGIDELVAEGRRIWQERAAVGDLAAVAARSRVTEAEALLDVDGLGAFRVLTWTAPRGT